MTDPRANTCNARRLSLLPSRPARVTNDPISRPDPVVASPSRPAQVHHHRSDVVTDAHVNPTNGVEHPLESDKHTLFFILNSSSSINSSLDRENTSAYHRDGANRDQVHEELLYRIVAPPATPPAWSSSDSSCASGECSPSMAVSSMIHDLRMSSPTTLRPASSRSARAYIEIAALSPPPPSIIVQDTRKSFAGIARRAPTVASRTTSRAELLSKLEKKRSRTCKMDGCKNYIVHKGLCCRHGGGKKCTIAGCNTSAKHLGLCWKHGGSIECDVEGCSKRAKARRLCWAHGGGTKCASPECEKVAVSGGLCWAHGGGKRCNFDNCTKPAYERTQNFCAKHHAEMQHVTYFEV